ncbi:MAG: GH116 family glycosyl hydrolase, partial [Planctomycetota bacterium]
RDAESPVVVSLEAFSPFIPLDVDDSSFPATILRFTVENTGSEQIDVELAGWLENFVAKEKAVASQGNRRNELLRGDGVVFLNCSAEPAEQPEPPDPRPDVLFDDFEGGTYDNWKIEGDAFGEPGARLSRYFHHQPLRGFQGEHLADSFRNDGAPGADARRSDAHKGKLVSKPFRIERRWIRFLIGGGPHPDTCIGLVVDGQPVRAASGNRSEQLATKGWNVASLEGKEATIEIVDENTGGWGHVMADEIVFTDNEPQVDGALEDHRDFGTMGLALLDVDNEAFATAEVSPEGLPDVLFAPEATERQSAVRSLDAQLVGAVGRPTSLEPGQSATLTFVVTWFFPKSDVPQLKTDTTRWYATRFTSARDVAVAIARDFESLASQTRLWKDTWYDSTLPYWFLDRTFLNTSILATQTCFRFKDGRFYGSEGVYCCPGTCTHVWGYVQATGRLFPSLEKSLRTRVDFQEGIAFYPESGAVSFRGEIYDGPRTAVDGQSGIVLRTYREHQTSTDDRFLEAVYPSARKAMSYLIDTCDADRDGILEGPQHNTLDASWYGKIAWLSLYYCAALRAAEQMALERDDLEFAEQVRAIADRGGKNIAEELFNGEYFIQKADPDHPESPGSFSGCEYSQLLGQGWACQVGLGRIIDNEKVKTALRSMWRYNFSTDVGPFRAKFTGGRWYAMPGEGGLIACTFPHGGAEVLGHGNRHFAGYLNECQNGYEYGATSLMMWEGLVDYALAHTRTLHDRYHASRRNPYNEIECGEHYARSMASYGLFTAVCGFEYHGPKGYIAFSPRMTPEDFRAAFTSAAGWGTFSQTRRKNTQSERLELKWGRLRLKSMAFDLPRDAQAASVRVSVAGTDVKTDHQMKSNRVVIRLAEPAEITAGQVIDVRIAY